MAARSLSALAFALFLSSAAFAAPVAVGPAATPFKLGALRLVALRDMDNVVPNDGSIFGKDAGPAAVAELLRKAGAPTDKVTLSVDALLVEVPGRTILIDTGLGPKVGGALLRSLALAGIDPGRITDVLITHSHGDHVGGLVTAKGDLAFPRATIRLSSVEWTWMKGKPANAQLVKAIAPKVKTFAPGAIVAPGIRSVSIPGHTPGQVGYEISSNGQRLLDIGDTAHSTLVSLARPDWINGYDADPVKGRASREAQLARLAASHERIFAPHFPFPGVGTIAKNGSGYIWRPAAL
jgi:glyoxylase-like metal-dependent hydrolase (beta-lactamase superfamily II)